MSQNSLALADALFPAMLTELQAVLKALSTLQSGAVAPTLTSGSGPNALWADSAVGQIKQRDNADTAWFIRDGLARNPVRAVTTTSDTLLATDAGGLITLSNAGAIAVTVPQATTNFGAGYRAIYANLGAGAATLTPTTSTINGAATLVLQQSESALIWSNGTNWSAVKIGTAAAATESAAGTAELATQTEGDAGTDDTRIMTALKTLIATSRWRPAAECRLTKSGANLQLDRFNGSRLFINGQNEQIPGAGITLAPTSATPSTLYYIYVYMNAGTMTLEYSATAPATDATYGHQIKTADATRTLVGLAYAVTGPAWADTDAQRLVLSYFNRRGIVGKSVLTANRTSTSASYAEINSELRVEFITWADETVIASADGPVMHSSTGSTLDTTLAFDGTTAEEVMSRFQPYANSAVGGFGLCLPKTGLAVGYHYATLLGRTSGATATWTDAGAAGERCSLKIMVQG